MSIEKRIVPFSRSFRSLIMKTRSAAKAIKDLKDLRALRGCACYRHAGPKGPEEKEETFVTVAWGPVPREHWIAGARTMARDRPSPYGEGKACFIVVRGPVPRERWIARAMARDRPSPYGEGDCFFTVARGPRRFPYAHPSGFPPRSLPGEGQALALREEAAFFLP